MKDILIVDLLNKGKPILKLFWVHTLSWPHRGDFVEQNSQIMNTVVEGFFGSVSDFLRFVLNRGLAVNFVEFLAGNALVRELVPLIIIKGRFLVEWVLKRFEQILVISITRNITFAAPVQWIYPWFFIIDRVSHLFKTNNHVEMNLHGVFAEFNGTGFILRLQRRNRHHGLSFLINFLD